LGVVVPMQQVFKAQKMLISKANAAGKPVIVSTQV
jgi:pyruvate kinase